MVGESSHETSHKRLLSEKTADGPCAQVCSWVRSHEDLGRPRKGPVRESWGKGLRGLGGMNKDGVKPLGLVAERPPATAEKRLRASVGAAVVLQSE